MNRIELGRLIKLDRSFFLVGRVVSIDQRWIENELKGDEITAGMYVGIGPSSSLKTDLVGMG